MDAQSRRIRLCVARCPADSDPNPDRNANGNTYTYVNAYGYCYAQNNTEAASNSTPSANAAVTNQCRQGVASDRASRKCNDIPIGVMASNGSMDVPPGGTV
jgi:hypothetical protein